MNDPANPVRELTREQMRLLDILKERVYLLRDARAMLVQVRDGYSRKRADQGLIGCIVNLLYDIEGHALREEQEIPVPFPLVQISPTGPRPKVKPWPGKIAEPLATAQGETGGAASGSVPPESAPPADNPERTNDHA